MVGQPDPLVGFDQHVSRPVCRLDQQIQADEHRMTELAADIERLSVGRGTLTDEQARKVLAAVMEVQP